MAVAIVTGSSGLVGSHSARLLSEQGFEVVGIDNDMRSYFFGAEGSTSWNRDRNQSDLRLFRHENLDIRDYAALEKVFGRHGKAIHCVVHTAAQPSHDWAAREPLTDFTVNATGTLNLLELTRLHAPDAAFVFTSTNKVYGDTPNRLPLVELETRYEIAADHRYRSGVDDTMSVDQTLHSLFGASKVAADIVAQEYGRYFGLRTGIFRAGCITGSGHSGAKLHGFLSYLVRCALTDTPYIVIGYGGKQVRDNIHAADLAQAFWHFIQKPRTGEVYNIGGGRHCNASVLEAIATVEKVTGKTLRWSLSDAARTGDHQWWISDNSKFAGHYPGWALTHSMESLVAEIAGGQEQRLKGGSPVPAAAA